MGQLKEKYKDYDELLKDANNSLLFGEKLNEYSKDDLMVFIIILQNQILENYKQTKNLLLSRFM